MMFIVFGKTKTWVDNNIASFDADADYFVNTVEQLCTHFIDHIVILCQIIHCRWLTAHMH